MTAALLRRRQWRAESTDAPVIAMTDVGMTYPNGKTALADVTVSIPSGDFVFLVGPSGAGKSTFIRLLIREQRPTAGRVVVAGRDLARLRRGQVPALRRRIGIVFQDFRLLANKTVAENVAFALEVTTLERQHPPPHCVDDLLVVGGHEHGGAELVDLDQQLDDLPARDRVQVARGLVGDEDGRIVHERARDRGALLLTA